MTGPSIEATTALVRRERRSRLFLWAVPAALAALVAVGLVARLLEGPSFVGSLAVENPTRYDVRILVSGAQGDRWTGVGTVRRETTSTFRDVIDQGDEWRFRFHAQGRTAGELTITRSELERAGWRLSIPPSVADRLDEDGAVPPP